ncbi:MAG: caspase family protein [Bradyrhizobiaceae bacterium]|nr:caspase family protein [Bradyrhizobiaceae bacterium]
MVTWTITVPIVALVFVCFTAAVAESEPVQPRVAFVVGEGGYAKAPLATSTNDAGLVAEALRSIGFEVVEGADLNQTDFLRGFRRFLASVENAGPNAVAVVYVSGYGFEFDGDNHLVMADARLQREEDIPLDTVRLSELLRAVAATSAHAKVVICDASRRLPFSMPGVRLANGLGAVDPPRRTLVAFSAAPGMVADDAPGPYGAFATAIAEMARTPGLELAEVFARVRARTHEGTQGRQTPWDTSAVGSPVVLVSNDTGSTQNPAISLAAFGPRPIRERTPEDAYVLAVTQDSLSSYGEFLAAFPRNRYATQVRSMLRARREALVWLRAVKMNTAESMWTYLQRYPSGMYVGDAERRLHRLSAPLAPPPDFAPVDFHDVPLLPEEPAQSADVRPSAPPQMLSQPPAAYLATLPPPPPRVGPRVLPAPVLPAMARFTGGMRRPLASLTGLPGVAGPVANSGSQSVHTFSDGGPTVANAQTQSAGSVINPVPLPTPAPLRAAALEKSRQLLGNASSSMGKTRVREPRSVR